MQRSLMRCYETHHSKQLGLIWTLSYSQEHPLRKNGHSAFSYSLLASVLLSSHPDSAWPSEENPRRSPTQRRAYCIARWHLTHTLAPKKARLSPGAVSRSSYPAAPRPTSSGAPSYPSSSDSSFAACLTPWPISA